MAQRFGRVNRFGDRCDSEIHIPYPGRFEDGDKFDQRRKKTLELLRQLNGDGCPAALGKLDATARVAAFAPEPTILPATDVLFDAWALTTISPPLVRTPLPGRPPVEPYLHGISDWQPPETHVAWRQEVEVITGDLLERYEAEELLEDYPLKPHELLRDRSDRVFDELQEILKRVGDNAATWIEDDRGQVEATVLGKLLNGDKKAVVNRIAYCRVLLPPSAGGLTEKGTLDGTLHFDPEHKVGYDVADEWFVDKEKTIRRRVRVRNDDPEQTPPKGMRLVRPALDTNPDADEHEETGVTGPRFWHWYTHPRSADDDGSKSSRLATIWEDHTRDVAYYATRYADALLKDQPELHESLVLAARSHDLGKQRAAWQRSIGNDDYPRRVYAKSGRLPDGSALRPRKLNEDYRHEFGSLLDSPQMPDLVLHLIAAHHGRGRPHFPANEAFDQNAKEGDATKLAAEVPRRFARLQRKYGRWGLAYLESLLRAADYAASASPSQTAEQL
jgi:CRISPR-associated endonuclease/helicase Cas3